MKKSRRVLGGNKGFTLAELIVVIVILAILVGVTLGGVYAYVNKAKINTDLNNANQIQTALSSVFATNADIANHKNEYKPGIPYNTSLKNSYNNGNVIFIYHWSKGGYVKKTANGIFFYGETDNRQQGMDWGFYNANGYFSLGSWYLLNSLVCSNMIEKYPKSQSNGEFWLIVCFNEDGSFRKVSCVLEKYSTSPITILKKYAN